MTLAAADDACVTAGGIVACRGCGGAGFRACTNGTCGTGAVCTVLAAGRTLVFLRCAAGGADDALDGRGCGNGAGGANETCGAAAGGGEGAGGGIGGAGVSFGACRTCIVIAAGGGFVSSERSAAEAVIACGSSAGDAGADA
jgi:hypothetical protein